MNNTKQDQSKQVRKPNDRSLSERDRDYVITLRKTGNTRIAIRSYCAGNKWLEENAKNVGNW